MEKEAENFRHNQNKIDYPISTNPLWETIITEILIV